MKLQKKHVIAIGLGVISVALGYAYLQYKKIMDYTLGLKSMKIKSSSAKSIDMDLVLNFTNKSNLSFDIKEQYYEIYANDVFISKMSNNTLNKIKGNSTSPININVIIDVPKVLAILKTSWLTILADTSKLKIRVPMKLKIGFYGINVSVPYVYENTLKGLLDEYVKPVAKPVEKKV